MTGDNPGYTLFKSIGSTNVYLVDGQGRIVHDWQVTSSGFDAVLRENGNLIVTGPPQGPRADFTDHVMGAGISGRFEEYTWDGELVWAYEFYDPGYDVHHGVEVLPNGNILFIAWEHISAEDAIAAGRDPALINEHGLWPDAIFEYSPEQDAIVWEWHTWDHIIQDFDPSKDNYGVVADNPQLADLNFFEPPERVEDWMHTNAIDYNPQLDQIVISVREFNELWIIDHNTTTEEAKGEAGDIMYRWGNPRAYDRGGISDRHISYQHDVQWVPAGYPGAGNIILYSNRHSTDPNATIEDMAENADYSKVVELIPPLLSDGTYELVNGEPYGPAEPTWTYDGLPENQFFSNFISGVQRLSTGDTFITIGRGANLRIVNPAGEIVWDYLPPIRNYAILAADAPLSERQIATFRARYYDADYPGFEGHDLSNAQWPSDLATTSTRYWGYLQHETENTLSEEFPTRYYAFFIPEEQVKRNVFSIEVIEGNIEPVVTVGEIEVISSAENDNSAGGPLTGTFTPEVSGWANVTVSHAGGDLTGVEGRFRLVRTIDWFSDIDPEIPRINYGTVVQDMISEDDTESLFTFFGEEGQQIKVRMQRDNASLDPVIELLDAEQEVLVSASAEVDTPVSQIEYTLPSTGVYFIHAARYTGNDRPSDTVGVYTMELILETDVD